VTVTGGVVGGAVTVTRGVVGGAVTVTGGVVGGAVTVTRGVVGGAVTVTGGVVGLISLRFLRRTYDTCTPRKGTFRKTIYSNTLLYNCLCSVRS
jgi:hypothetical protein